MRKLILIAALALPAGSAAKAPAPATGPTALGSSTPLERNAECRRLPGAEQAREPVRTGPKRLGELPRGEAYYAVWREVDGCFQPAMLRRGARD